MPRHAWRTQCDALKHINTVQAELVEARHPATTKFSPNGYLLNKRY
jgi:hypothetical protein